MTDLIPIDGEDLPALKSFDKKGLERISRGLVEHRRALNIFGRKNSQTMNKLMSLTMLHEGPYRRLRQCLAEVDSRLQALASNGFKLRKDRVKLKKVVRRLQEANDPLESERLLVRKDELEYRIKETVRLAEGSLKEIAALQDAYNQIREAYGIPEKWDEADFEASEARSHLLSAFRLALMDMMNSGRLSHAAFEYLAQFGVHPFTGFAICQDYVLHLEEMKKNGKVPDINHYFEWLDANADKFGDEFKKAMKHVGIESLVTEWCQFREVLNTS